MPRVKTTFINGYIMASLWESLIKKWSVIQFGSDPTDPAKKRIFNHRAEQHISIYAML